MSKFDRKQIVNLLMALILFLAPFESLFAQVTHNLSEAKNSPSAHISAEFHPVNCQFMGASDHKNSHSCHQHSGVQCENCVFCNAVVASHTLTIEKTQFVLNSIRLLTFTDRIPDLDIRPPKHFISI